jgi:hypothetical protein
MTDAARDADIDRSTLYRWLDGVPEFVAELNRRKLEQAQALRGELQGLALDAVRTLRDLMTSVDAPAAVRFRAALAVLHAVGADAPEAIGPVNPADVGEQWSTRDLLRAIHGLP